MDGHLVAEFVEELYALGVVVGVDIVAQVGFTDLVEHDLVGGDEYFGVEHHNLGGVGWAL